MGKLLPLYEDLIPFYPTDKDADMVKKEIGGNVDKSWYKNTCIIRISKALNYANHPIPADSGIFKTRLGSDGKWYGLGVQDFWSYLERVYGKPAIQARRDEKTRKISIEEFQQTRGIIGFRVDGWRGSSGHFTLSNGYSLVYAPQHDYFALSENAALWTTGASKVSIPAA